MLFFINPLRGKRPAEGRQIVPPRRVLSVDREGDAPEKGLPPLSNEHRPEILRHHRRIVAEYAAPPRAE